MVVSPTPSPSNFDHVLPSMPSALVFAALPPALALASRGLFYVLSYLFPTVFVLVRKSAQMADPQDVKTPSPCYSALPTRLI